MDESENNETGATAKCLLNGKPWKRQHWRKHHFYAHFNFVSSNRILNARAPVIILPPTPTSLRHHCHCLRHIYTAIGYILHDAIEKLFFFSQFLLTELCHVFPSDTIFWTLSLSLCSSIFHTVPQLDAVWYCSFFSLAVCLPSPVLGIVVRCLPFVFSLAHPLCHAMCLVLRLLFPKPLRKCQ